jgi:hypothetical protein
MLDNGRELGVVIQVAPQVFEFARQVCTNSTRAVLLVWVLTPVICRAGDRLAPADAYPSPDSKKGLQVEIVDDALALGVKHAALNVNLSDLVEPSPTGGQADYLSWSREGQTFHFRRGPIDRLDHTIKSLSSRGVVVHLIILVYHSSDDAVNRVMLHPDYDNGAPNHLSAFNTHTSEGKDWLAATMEFLAQRWSRPDEQFGRVAGYILGNEVNSHWWWSNMGRATMHEFADDYLLALRAVHRSVRQHSPWARVYVSLDHHWGIRYPAADDRQAFPGKEFIDYLAEHAKDGGPANFDWHVAFHSYPENLFEPRFWNDRTAMPEPSTPRITFKNLEVLTEYLRRPELLHNGQPRRAILSEQGFHTPDGPDGEQVQAAAYCCAYRKIAALDGIDAFILHRHIDHPDEGGLRLGLRRRTRGESNPHPTKLIYDCFRLADTPDWEPAFQFALPIIGIQTWADLP